MLLISQPARVLANDRTHSLTASFAVIAIVYVVAGSLIISLRIRDPVVEITNHVVPG